MPNQGDDNEMLDWTPVIKWFGFIPNFHDAEMISMDLRRAPELSTIRGGCLENTDRVDERRYAAHEGLLRPIPAAVKNDRVPSLGY